MNSGASTSGGGLVQPSVDAGTVQPTDPAAPPAPSVATTPVTSPSLNAPTSLGPAIADISDRLRAVIAQVNALTGQGTAATPATPAAPGTTPAATGYIVPGRLANGTSALDTAAPATGAGLQLTTPADKPLVDAMLAQLQRSPTGSAILAGIQRIGTKVTVMDDAQFAAAGHADSGAYYDPSSDTMYLRRSRMQTELQSTAATFAHEATHALDDIGQVGAAYVTQETARLNATGALTAAQVEQLGVNLSLAKEARAYTVHATVMRELGVTPHGMLEDVVRTGANDLATYQKIFGMLVAAGPAGGYNTTGANVAPFQL